MFVGKAFKQFNSRGKMTRRKLRLDGTAGYIDKKRRRSKQKGTHVSRSACEDTARRGAVDFMAVLQEGGETEREKNSGRHNKK